MAVPCHSERSEESLFDLNRMKERFLGKTRLGMTTGTASSATEIGTITYFKSG
jgi:hypothetical protein